MNDELEAAIISLIDQRLAEKGFSAFAVPYHKHTTTDAGQLDASQSLINSPQPYIAPVSLTVLSTGGSAVLSTSDSAVIADIRTKLNLLLVEQTNIGLLKKN